MLSPCSWGGGAFCASRRLAILRQREYFDKRERGAKVVNFWAFVKRLRGFFCFLTGREAMLAVGDADSLTKLSRQHYRRHPEDCPFGDNGKLDL